ncbi:unnamed protein product [Soboliphyme baturini]|uniref:Ribosome-binding factor A n=1 Tax=Soboliphyme baturini TaxID=241478 RepID=A0A183IV32_9BILA|nr:unnamed protein product [Soboliphyme baturini]
MKQSVAHKIAEIFTEDFPIPNFYFIKIKNVAVHSVTNAYLIAMDLHIDQRELSKLLRQGIQNMSFN